jgi:hypothetical protein
MGIHGRPPHSIHRSLWNVAAAAAARIKSRWQLSSLLYWFLPLSLSILSFPNIVSKPRIPFLYPTDSGGRVLRAFLLGILLEILLGSGK